MSSFFQFVRNQYADLPLPQPPKDIGQATYVVTGANTGLGYQCVQHLFRMKAHRVILAVRSLDKGRTALDTIRRDTNSTTSGEVWQLDLQSSESVEGFAKRLDTLDRIDAFIANAGVITASFQTVDDLELSLAVNTVYTMLLALRVIPKLQRSARKHSIQPRLVFVSSSTAFGSRMDGYLESLSGNIFDAMSTEKGFKTLNQ